jgi:hypothetical protein
MLVVVYASSFQHAIDSGKHQYVTYPHFPIFEEKAEGLIIAKRERDKREHDFWTA